MVGDDDRASIVVQTAVRKNLIHLPDGPAGVAGEGKAFPGQVQSTKLRPVLTGRETSVRTKIVVSALPMNRSTLHFTIAVTLAIAVLSARILQADDWPQWRGPNRDSVW